MRDWDRRLRKIEGALRCQIHHEPYQCLSCAMEDRQSPEAQAADVRQRILAKLEQMAARRAVYGHIPAQQNSG